MPKGVTINNLPDNILLEIFSYLPVKDRCLCGRVCRRWRKIVQDYSLWKHVDLLPYQIDLHKLWKLMRAHLSSKLCTLRIRGVTHKKTHEIKPTLSESILEELRSRCPSLLWLHLQQGSVAGLSSASLLPCTLTHLTLRRCTWQHRLFKDSASHFINLKYLDLGETVRVDNNDLGDIAEFTTLTTLKLDGCYRVGESGLQKIAATLVSLQILHIKECHTTDLIIHHMGRNLKCLRNLDISGSSLLNSSSMETLLLLNNLETLSCTVSSQMNVSSIRNMHSISKLKHLELHLKKNDLVQDFEAYLAALKGSLPNCCIVVLES